VVSTLVVVWVVVVAWALVVSWAFAVSVGLVVGWPLIVVWGVVWALVVAALPNIATPASAIAASVILFICLSSRIGMKYLP
jgi:hypothetical protein